MVIICHVIIILNIISNDIIIYDSANFIIVIINIIITNDIKYDLANIIIIIILNIITPDIIYELAPGFVRSSSTNILFDHYPPHCDYNHLPEGIDDSFGKQNVEMQYFDIG